MHGELAQLVALAAHGSRFLARSAGSEPPELYPTASVFCFTNSLEFHRHTRRLGIIPVELSVSRSCAAWFADLRSRGATTLRLTRSHWTPRNRVLAPYIEAGFSGGLDVSLVACLPRDRFELWSGRWAVTAAEHPERRIWSARFDGRPARVTLSPQASLADSAARLAAALDSAIALVAGRQYFESWEQTFRGARAVLSSASPEVPYHPDLLPSEGYALEARRLLATASHAWVFGGMGTWNDVALDDTRYKPVTSELFEAVLQAVVVAANSA